MSTNWMKQSLTCAPLVLALAACGGGGSPTTETTTATAVAAVTVAGIAAKGPMLGATVNFYKVNADGTKGDLLTTVTTSTTDGSYTATISNYSGVVLAEVSANADTKMVDEATNTIISAPSALTMRASFPTVTGQTSYSAQINPFTEMATVQAAKSTGGLSAANVAKTNADMAAALTFNPLSEAPAFDKTGQPTNAAGVAVASVSKMAQDGSLGCSSGSQADKVLCVVNQLKTTAGTLTGGVGETDGSNSNPVTLALQSAITSVSKTAELPPVILMPPAKTGETPTTTLAAAIAKAKKFFGTLRSNINALSTANDNGVTFKSQLEDFQAEVDGGLIPISSGATDVIQDIQRGINWHDDVINGRELFTKGKYFYKDGKYAGWCGFFYETKLVNAEYTITYAKDASEINVISCEDTVKYQYAHGYCDYTTQPCVRAWLSLVEITPNKGDTTDYSVNTLLRYRSIINNVAQKREFFGADPKFKSQVKVTRLGQKVNSINWIGDLAPTYAIKGPYTYTNGVYIEESPTVLGDKHVVNFATSWTTDSNDVERLALSGKIDLVKSEKTVSSIEFLPGSLVTIKPDDLNKEKARNGSQSAVFKLKATVGSSAFQGDLAVGDLQLDASGQNYMATKASFTGKMSNANNEFFVGAFSTQILDFSLHNKQIQTSFTNPLVTSSTFTGTVNIPNRPMLTLTISGKMVNFGDGKFNETSTGQYRQDAIDASQVVNFKSAKRYSDSHGVMTLETAGGIKVVVDGNTKKYPITKGSLVIGQVDTTQNRIDYKDESYEIY